MTSVLRFNLKYVIRKHVECRNVINPFVTRNYQFLRQCTRLPNTFVMLLKKYGITTKIHVSTLYRQIILIPQWTLMNH